jgi:addiction module RelE/StbE family toxin
MNRTVRILRRAQADLDEIKRYVERDRPQAAMKLLEQILSGIESLQDYPDRGKTPLDERLRLLGFRVLIQGDYLVFYKVLRRQVRVYRVIHGRRKYEHLV